jgi:PKD domain
VYRDSTETSPRATLALAYDFGSVVASIGIRVRHVGGATVITKRIRLILVAVACATVALPAGAAATISALRVNYQTGPLGCADVTVGTTTLIGAFKLGSLPVAPVVADPVNAVNSCAGGAGRSITFNAGPGGLVEGLDLEIRGNDETTPIVSHMPIVRRNDTTAHLLELPAAAQLNGVAVPTPTASAPATTPFLISSVAAGRTVTVNPVPGAFTRTYFYSDTDTDNTSVQINDPAPNVDVLVELIRADGTVVFSRTVRPAVGGGSATFFDGPPLGAGASVRVTQGAILNRTRPFGSAELRPDGFRAVLAPGAPNGRYFHNLALHADSTSPADPLGPCQTLQVSGALPGECTGLTTPRTEVVATGLLPVAADSLEVESTWTEGDRLSVRIEQAGVFFGAASGEVRALGITGGPLTGTLTVPRPAPGVPFIFTKAGIAPGFGGEGAGTQFPFAVKVLPDSVVSYVGGSAPLQATLTLEAAVDGDAVKGRTRPGSRVRVVVRSGAYLVADTAVTAASDGTFSIPVGAAPSGSRVEVGAGDPASRTYASRTLFTGRPPIQIQGAVDQQLVRGVVNLTATNATTETGWSIDDQAPRTPGSSLSVNTALRQDGPLRIDVAHSFNTEDYLYLKVDNTPPYGGAGADQRVRVARDAAIVTNANDANGIASVQVAFGDGTTATQSAAQVGAPALHRYTRAGSFTAKVTITDNAGNVRQDESVVTVTAAPVLRLTGKIPTSVLRGKVLRFSQRTSVAGTLRVQLIGPTGKVLRRAAARTTVANGRATISLRTKGLKRGRYLLVRQLVGADGEAGPVLIGSVRIR